MEIQSPDFEVIVRVNATDVVVAAGFLTGSDEIDLLVGCSRPDDVARSIKLLEFTIAGLHGASWQSLDDLDLPSVDDEETDGSIPF